MKGLLRAVWDEPRAPGAPGRVWRDWALVAVLLVAVTGEAILRSHMPDLPVQIALAVGLIPTLLWRRTQPLLMVAIAFLGCYAVQAATHGVVPQMQTQVYLVLLPYSLFRWGSGREMVAGIALVVANMLISMALGNTSISGAIAGSGVLLAAGAVGVALRYRAMARARELMQVQLLERERLARDLHDTVAHHVSAIAIRAQAGLAASATQPNAATEALHLIESEASRALSEMRAIVKVLRPSPGVADLQQLAGTGTPSVAVEIRGDVDDLPPAVGSAVYRLAQESVTNAKRHARHATHIKVSVAADARSVQLRVSDDGDAPTPTTDSHGYGLQGMTERAGLLGGTFEAGPNPDRGWTVTAVLPRTGSPA